MAQYTRKFSDGSVVNSWAIHWTPESTEECDYCGNQLVGRDDDMLSVLALTEKKGIANHSTLCEPCAITLGCWVAD